MLMHQCLYEYYTYIIYLNHVTIMLNKNIILKCCIVAYLITIHYCNLNFLFEINIFLK